MGLNILESKFDNANECGKRNSQNEWDDNEFVYAKAHAIDAHLEMWMYFIARAWCLFSVA